jgi:hypothetical protein
MKTGFVARRIAIAIKAAAPAIPNLLVFVFITD